MDVPCARAHGLAELCRGLGDEARRSLLDGIVLPVAWYPESHVESLCELAWTTLACRDEAAFFAFVHPSVDRLWSRVHRVLVGLTTPHVPARRAPAMWRHDHTHGTLEVALEEQRGTVRVRGYPYPAHQRHGSGPGRVVPSHPRPRACEDGARVARARRQGTFVASLAWIR